MKTKRDVVDPRELARREDEFRIYRDIYSERSYKPPATAHGRDRRSECSKCLARSRAAYALSSG